MFHVLDRERGDANHNRYQEIVAWIRLENRANKTPQYIVPAMLTEPANREYLPDRAIEFLVERVAEQAMLERAPLSDTEKKMLRFSASDSEPDLAALDDFNDKCNKDDYEERIIGLVRRAHAFDRKHERAAIWKEALHAAKGQDFYLATIIEERGLSPQPKLPSSFPRKDVLWLIAYVVALGGPYVYSKVFQIHEDWEKALLVACVAFILAMMRVIDKRDEPGPESFSLFGPEGSGRWSSKRGSRKRKPKRQDDQSA